MGDSGDSTRVLLFTDTLGDVNGVSRFIRNIAVQAAGCGRDLSVLTSTRLEVPREANIVNFAPLVAGKMPKYENLEIALPPLRRMMRHAARVRPHAIHVSTPGPVGMCGVLVARRLRVPLAGVYHTDFPAYVDRLFDDAAFTFLTRAHMRLVYRRFAAVFTRSHDYAASVQSLGVAAQRVHRLQPGIDTTAFAPTFRDLSVWPRLGVPAAGAKVLYCGRVSVEKNLPFLAAVWKRVRAQLPGAHLVVVGDGPYLEAMRKDLEGPDAHFLGFRQGKELSDIYASSDLFVFPSTTDTLGQVVMESQCSGLPVIVTDRGGPKELVRDGETGFVLPAASAHAWSAAISALVRDEARRKGMGAAAERAVRPMSIAASFDQFWSVHEGLRTAV